MAGAMSSSVDDSWFYHVTKNRFVFVPPKAYQSLTQKGWTDEAIVDFYADDKPTSEQLQRLRAVLATGHPTRAVGGSSLVPEPAALPKAVGGADQAPPPPPQGAAGGATAPIPVPPPASGITTQASKAKTGGISTSMPKAPPALQKAGGAISPTIAATAAKHSAVPPVPSAASGAITKDGTVLTKITKDDVVEPLDESYEGYTKAGCNGMWHTRADIHGYVHEVSDQLADTPTRGFEPQNAYQYPSVQDFVSTVRYESSQGGQFVWPFHNISYEVGLAIALHNLPPGFMVTIPNGRPCPEEIASPQDGTCLEYWHGTTSYALTNGILRRGLMPVFGAGVANTLACWGVPVPMVYLSRSVGCAAHYPGHPGLRRSVSPSTNEMMHAGEIISRDGTPPLRVLLHCKAVSQNQLWSRKGKKGANDQRAFRPKDVFITAITWWALQPEMVSPPQMHYVWEMVDSDGKKIEADYLCPDHNADQAAYPHKEAYGVLRWYEEPTPLDITRKTLLSLRVMHFPSLAVREVLDRENANLPAAVINELYDWQTRIPVIERTTLNLEARVRLHKENSPFLAKLDPKSSSLPVKAPTASSVAGGVINPTASSSGPTAGSAGGQPATPWQSWGRSGWWQQSENIKDQYYSWYENEQWNRNNYGHSGWEWGRGNQWSFGRAENWEYSDDTWSWTPSQGSGSGDAKRRKTAPVGNVPHPSGNTTEKWIKRAKKSYTRFLRLFIDIGYKPIFWYYYGVDKGNYPPITEDQTCDVTDVYPVPAGEHPHPDSVKEDDDWSGEADHAKAASHVAAKFTQAAVQAAVDPTIAGAADQAVSSAPATTPKAKAEVKVGVQPNPYPDIRLKRDQRNKEEQKAAEADYKSGWKTSKKVQQWVEKDHNIKVVGNPPPAATGDQPGLATTGDQPGSSSKSHRPFEGATPVTKETVPMEHNIPSNIPKGSGVATPDWKMGEDELKTTYSKGYSMLMKSTKADEAEIAKNAAIRTPLTAWFPSNRWRAQNAATDQNQRTVFHNGKPFVEFLDEEGNVIDKQAVYEPPEKEKDFPKLPTSTAFLKSSETLQKRPAGAFVSYASDKKKAQAEAQDKEEESGEKEKYTRTPQEKGDQPSTGASSSSVPHPEGSPLADKPLDQLTEEDFGLMETKIKENLEDAQAISLFCPAIWGIVSSLNTAEKLDYATFYDVVQKKYAEQQKEAEKAQAELEEKRKQAVALKNAEATPQQAIDEDNMEPCDDAGQAGIAIGGTQRDNRVPTTPTGPAEERAPSVERVSTEVSSEAPAEEEPPAAGAGMELQQAPDAEEDVPQPEAPEAAPADDDMAAPGEPVDPNLPEDSRVNLDESD